MAAATDGPRQPPAPGQIDGADPVGHTGTPGGERGVGIVGPVPDASLPVIILIARPDGDAAHASGELGDSGFPDGTRCGRGRGHGFLLVGVSHPGATLGSASQRELNANSTRRHPGIVARVPVAQGGQPTTGDDALRTVENTCRCGYLADGPRGSGQVV